MEASDAGCKLHVLELELLLAEDVSLSNKPGARVLLFQGRPGEEDVTDAPEALGGRHGTRAGKIGDGGSELGFVALGALLKAAPTEELGDCRHGGGDASVAEPLDCL